MKKLLAVLLFLCGSGFAQSNVCVVGYAAPGTNGQARLVRICFGAGLNYANGVLTVNQSPADTHSHVYDVRLTADADGQYPLPSGANAASARVYVNGLRYLRGVDYTVALGVIVPTCMSADPQCNWPPPAQTIVVADFDK